MTRRQRIDDLTALALPEEPALAPDGSEIVYVLSKVDADADRNVRSLWRVGTMSGAPRQLTRGDADFSPAWSPDGTRVAFLRGADGPAQMWLLPMDGGEPEQLTSLPLGAGAPMWSPDGTKIAFAAPVDLQATPGEREQDRARRTTEPVVADRLDYRADGFGLLATVRNHVHVLDVRTRQCRQVTDGDWHASGPAWSPDSARLAFSAVTAPDADLEFRKPVHVLDVTDPAAVPELAGLADGVCDWVAWTGDGTALLVIGRTDRAVGHAGLLRVPLDGDPAPVPNLAAALDRNVMLGRTGYSRALPQFVEGGASVLFCVRDRGYTHLYATAADGSGVPRPVVTGAGRSVSGLSVARRAAGTTSTGTAGTGAGDIAVTVLATPTSFGEIVTVDLATGIETVRTQHGANLADVELFARQEREFAISDGMTVHGWLIRDPDATGPQPLLLDLHGGHSAWNGAADPIRPYHQVLAARGWTVLLLNSRGSDGYGERFYTTVLGAWGEADARDLLEPIDALVAEQIVDQRRLAVTGYSYGGYLTCYLTSRDGRFAAAVASAVITDLTSFAGTTDYSVATELGGRPWEARDRYAAMSPLSRVDQVRTPTLLMQGAADLRCPVGQAEQWHTALRERGVPTRLVLYPNASHALIFDGAPSARMDYSRRLVEWVEQYTSKAKRPKIDAAHWQRRLAVLARRHRVPGATLGILRVHPDREDELAEAAFGVLNTDTGVEVTTDSVFQIGSITKVWTATIAMQLAEEGVLDLDAPVAETLPELRLADPEIAKTVTMRHLLTHTSGIDGDVFADTGRGDDCLEKYVALLSEARQNHPLGAAFSYCNSGFSLAGRMIEKLTRRTWDVALRDRLVAPLGLRHTVTLPEEALMFRAAVGHVKAAAGPDSDPWSLAAVWGLPRSVGPAGLITSSAADVLAFARLHLAGGVTHDGTRLLSEASTRVMTECQVKLPDTRSPGDSWGIGWARYRWDGHQLIGHDGGTIGQSAFLRLLPEEGLAVVLLTNGGSTRDLYEELYREIFAELTGVAMPHPLGPPAAPVHADFRQHAGTYERAGARFEVLAGDDGPVLRMTALGLSAELSPDPVTEEPMTPVGPDLYVVRAPGTQAWAPVLFYELRTGEKYLHYGSRAAPKLR